MVPSEVNLAKIWNNTKHIRSIGGWGEMVFNNNVKHGGINMTA
jgi:hypothetical protein